MSPLTYAKRAGLLRALADKLESVEENAFSLKTWGETLRGEHSCRTTCCAIGYACFMDEFREVGLRAITGMDEKCESFEELLNWPAKFVTTVPAFEGHLSFNAISRLFGISHAACGALFLNDAYDFRDAKEPHPKIVAKRLRAAATIMEDGSEEVKRVGAVAARRAIGSRIYGLRIKNG